MLGSIPACAGEPCQVYLIVDGLAVYPRVCGGTRYRRRERHLRSRLSPRVRGNLQGTVVSLPRLRSIPACAGEPQEIIQSESERAALSPRVRGNLTPSSKPGVGQGSIPACAGEPDAAKAQRRFRKLYPRVCGGTPVTRSCVGARKALSRVCGGTLLRCVVATGDGSIPACAGEPAACGNRRRAGRVYPACAGEP